MAFYSMINVTIDERIFYVIDVINGNDDDDDYNEKNTYIPNGVNIVVMQGVIHSSV